jgi:hypothetical protein
MRRQAGKQHLLGKKSPARKHSLEGQEPVFYGDYNNVMGQMPHSKIKKMGKQMSFKKVQILRAALAKKAAAKAATPAL